MKNNLVTAMSGFCVLAGTITTEDRVRTRLDALKEEFSRTLLTRFVFEAEKHSPCISRELEWDMMVIANARKVRLIYEATGRMVKVRVP